MCQFPLLRSDLQREADRYPCIQKAYKEKLNNRPLKFSQFVSGLESQQSHQVGLLRRAHRLLTVSKLQRRHKACVFSKSPDLFK